MRISQVLLRQVSTYRITMCGTKQRLIGRYLTSDIANA